MELKYQIMLSIAVVLTVVNVYANVYFSRRESSDYIWHGYAALWYPVLLYGFQVMTGMTNLNSPDVESVAALLVTSGGIPLLLFNMLAPLYVRYLIYRHRMNKAVQSVEPEA